MKKLSILIIAFIFSSILTYAQDKMEITISNKYNIITKGAVDLGLPSGTLWAATNLGANTPFETGNTYAWGETIPFTQKEVSNEDLFMTWKYYKFYHIGGPETGNYLTKYNTDENLGAIDGKTVLETEDDAASISLGDEWSLPNKAHFEELLTECEWIHYTNDNLKQNKNKFDYMSGYIVVGPNGNAIFLYATEIYTCPDYYSMYWSSEISDNPIYAYALYIEPDSSSSPAIHIMSERRAENHCIRPVKTK